MKKRKYFWICALILVSFIVAGILIANKKIRINLLFAENYELHGVDVSHYQGKIDWSKLAQQNVDFAYIKATEGSSYLDECFIDNWQEAAKTDLYVGAYHFFSFDSDGAKQAAFYIETVGNLDGRLIPAVDVEFYGDKEKNPPAVEDVREELKKMLAALEDYYHVKPVIYSTYTVYNKYIRGAFEEYPLWIRNVYYPPMGGLGDRWTFWQYTDTAVLEGYEGTEKYIDRNVFKGTGKEFEKLIVSR